MESVSDITEYNRLETIFKPEKTLFPLKFRATLMTIELEVLRTANWYEADIHFTAERVFNRMFLSAASILEYRAAAAFYRRLIFLAIEEAERKTGKVFLKKKDKAFLRDTNRRRLEPRTPKTRFPLVQIHVYATREIKTAFLHAIKALGYTSAAEFFREKMRLAIDNAGRTIGFSLRLTEERL